MRGFPHNTSLGGGLTSSLAESSVSAKKRRAGCFLVLNSGGSVRIAEVLSANVVPDNSLLPLALFQNRPPRSREPKCRACVTQ